ASFSWRHSVRQTLKLSFGRGENRAKRKFWWLRQFLPEPLRGTIFKSIYKRRCRADPHWSGTTAAN
ncbi:hypothetical protein JTM67_33990, partial [Pseudomonas aeruginosa]|uniref:hypothetical protein n=1 Tax=Pseudomonas aeruginosa TaxID=287 RepID=UPI001D7165CB